jgi:multidrug resistance efflux pump
MQDKNTNAPADKEELKELIAEEKKLIAEEKGVLKTIRNDARLLGLAVIAVAAATIAGVLYWRVAGSRLYVDKAQIVAPVIALSPKKAGTLDEVYVGEGDTVAANQPVARVGGELIKAKVAGQVVSAPLGAGAAVNPSTAVVSMIARDDLRVVVRVDEDKGLDGVRVGQVASFTVDAFGSRTFSGTVDEISPTSRDGGVVFNISDKRETRQFDVKIRFDASGHPEIRNGMSARVWIYKD